MSTYYKSKPANKNKEENKVDWKKAECGAAWKKQTQKGVDFYFMRIKLEKMGIPQELLLKCYKNNYPKGDNPPTMHVYCFDDDNPWMEDMRNSPESPMSLDLPSRPVESKKPALEEVETAKGDIVDQDLI